MLQGIQFNTVHKYLYINTYKHLILLYHIVGFIQFYNVRRSMIFPLSVPGTIILQLVLYYELFFYLIYHISSVRFFPFSYLVEEGPEKFKQSYLHLDVGEEWKMFD